MLKKKGADGVTKLPIWCQICQTKHIDPKLDQERRQRIVLGSSTLAHLWKSNGFNSPSHIDFDCIIGEIMKSFYFFWRKMNCYFFTNSLTDCSEEKTKQYLEN